MTDVRRWAPLLVDQPGVPDDTSGILQVSLAPDAATWAVEATATLYLRPGLPADQLARLTEWALERLDRLREHGPEPDGWGIHEDGALLQLYAVEHVLSDS